jgi:hypothetical protein
MPQNRSSRTSEERDSEARPSAWQSPSNYPTPPNTNGIVHRWIRTQVKGEPDTKNVSKRFREGWVPVPVTEHPDLAGARDINTRFEQHIEIGGLLLCRMPKEISDARKAHYDQKNQQQMHSLNNSMFSLEDRRMPWLKPIRQTWVEAGGKTISTPRDQREEF